MLHQSPDRRSSEYADEGTRAHDEAAAHLVTGTDSDDLDIQRYIAHCRSLVTPSSEVFIERGVPLFYSPNDTGTLDYAVVREDGLFIRDLKFGQGVLVEAGNNEQLAIYALSLVRQLDAEGLHSFSLDMPVSLGIVQPRHHGGEPIRTWDITIDQLEDFCQTIEYKAEMIQRGLHEYNPGEHACRWCDYRNTCPARRADALAPLQDFGGVDFLSALPDLTKAEAKLPVEDRILASLTGACDTPVAELTDEQLVAVWKNTKKITRWLDDIGEMLTDRAHAGNPAPGTKLVQGRPGNRKWADEAAADKLLALRLGARERYVRTLVSPAVAEELLDLGNENARFRRMFGEAVVRSDGRPVLAHESDKRPAITSALDALPEETNNEGEEQ